MSETKTTGNYMEELGMKPGEKYKKTQNIQLYLI